MVERRFFLGNTNMKGSFAVLLAATVFLLGCVQTGSPTESIPETAGSPGTVPAGGEPQELSDNARQNAADTDTEEGSGVPGAPKYEDFSAAKYEAARKEGKPIWLSFHANWCPTCARQEPINEQAFARADIPNETVAFRVPFNDSDTLDTHKEIAKEFGIVYQHTQVVIDTRGEVIHRSTGFISEERIVGLMQEAAR